MIVKILKSCYVGSRLFSQGVQYEVEDSIGEMLIKRDDATEEQPEEPVTEEAPAEPKETG